jgi:hypothetical protein
MMKKFLSDNYRNEGSRIHKSKVGILRVLVELRKEIHTVIRCIHIIIRFINRVNRNINTFNRRIDTVNK